MDRPQRPARQRGVTVIELMVGMVLGLLVTAGLIQLFVSSGQTYRMQETSARLQEDGRFALDNITEATHMAAYLGCANLYRFGLKTVGGQQVRGPRVVAINAPQFNDSNFLQAYDFNAGNWTPNLPPQVINVILGTQTLNVAPGTDVLTVTGGSPCITHLAQNMGNRAADLSLQGNTCGYRPNDVLLISDCLSNADMFRATNVQPAGVNYQRPLPGGGTQGTSIPIFTLQHGFTDLNGGPANSSNALSVPYRQPVPGAENVAQVMQLLTRTYFVAPSLNAAGAMSAQCGSGQAVCSLWEFDGVNYNELVEGVQDMQLTYGIDNGDENANLYVTPTDPNFRIANVMNLRIAILMLSTQTGMAASAQPLLRADPNAAFAGVFSPPAGFNPNGRLARVFTTTINLRNRTLDFAP